jgi:hypothetical protein
MFLEQLPMNGVAVCRNPTILAAGVQSSTINQRSETAKDEIMTARKAQAPSVGIESPVRLKPYQPPTRAGFAVRRVPPADGGDGPWRIMQPANHVDDTPTTAVRNRDPVFIPPAALEPLSPPATYPNPEAAPTPDGSSGTPTAPPVSLHHIVTRLNPAPVASDPTGPHGPDLNRMRALVQARQRAVDGPSTLQNGSHANNGYVLHAQAQGQHILRGRQLYARYQRENGIFTSDLDIDPCDLANWALSLKPTVSASAWRTYRGAAIARIQTVPHIGLEEAVAMLEADIGAEADEARAVQHGRLVGLQRSEQAYRCSKKDFDAILEILPKFSRSAASAWLADWMTGILHTGLWPGEWAAVDLEVRQDPDHARGRRAWLHVINKHAASEREIAVDRTLDLTNFTDDAIGAVQRMVNHAEEWVLAGEFEARQSQNAQLLYEICASLFPKQRQRYSLYSLRHQFIANMKTIYEPAEVAALIGRLADGAESKGHGKRRVAWDKDQISETPLPMPEKVLQMRKRLRQYEERRDIQLMRRALNMCRKAGSKPKI